MPGRFPSMRIIFPCGTVRSVSYTHLSDIRLEPEDFVIEGRTVTSLKGSFLLRKREDGYDRNALYQDYGNREYEKITARMIPYFAWDNRGMDEMRVWLPVMDAGERRAGREN